MARTLSADEYQELGRSYYKLKQYGKAIEAFTNAIEISVIPTATLYDYRAACHDKLADYNSAVKDGRQAILAQKQDVQGYLRTASALQKMNKHDTALGIYKYGMKNVPVDHEQFPLLQLLHDRLTRNLSPPRAVDPLTVLPIELVEMVISYLSFRQMVNCLRVSKGWKNFLISRPGLWTNLDLSRATKPVSRRFLANAIRYGNNSLDTLVAHRVQHTDILRNIATACKSLHKLTILSVPHMLDDSLIEMVQCARNLKYLSVDTEISLDTASQILRRRPELEQVAFNSVELERGSLPWKGGPFKWLHTLTLRCFGGGMVDVTSLLSGAVALQSLTLVHDSIAWVGVPGIHTTSLTSFVVQNFHILHLPMLPPTLKQLVFQPRNCESTLRTLEHATRSCCRSLTELTLGGAVPLWPDLLSKLLDVYTDDHDQEVPIEDGKPLEHLSLRGEFVQDPQGATPVSISTYLLTSPRVLTRALTSLSLPGLPLRDEDVSVITNLTSLTEVDVSRTKISGLGIRKFVDGSPALRYINADHCYKVSSRDAIEYAAKKGVHVSCTMMEPTGKAKGRRVFYG